MTNPVGQVRSLHMETLKPDKNPLTHYENPFICLGKCVIFALIFELLSNHLHLSPFPIFCFCQFLIQLLTAKSTYSVSTPTQRMVIPLVQPEFKIELSFWISWIPSLQLISLQAYPAIPHNSIF